MKIVIAPDSFKGSMSAREAAISIERGIKKAFPHAETVLCPMADGGEGTMDALVEATNGHKESVFVTGPLGEKIQAEYGVLGDQKTCIIEVASASGIMLVPEGRLNPLIATTFGTGELIKKALDDGLRSFILALGGSATNDGGAGMLQALGVKLMDEKRNEISYGGAELIRIKTVDINGLDQRIKESTFLIASDVQNPLIGQDGASYVFGPQKGATADEVKRLDASLSHWADKVEEATGIPLHEMKGAGAAGGIGGAFQAFFPSKMRRGIDVVIEYTGLQTALQGADLVITGEGKADFQTASGKTPMGVAQEAKLQNIPTIVLAGSIGKGIDVLHQYGIVSATSMINQPMTLNEAMLRADELLELSAEQAVRTYFYYQLFREKEGSQRGN